MTKTDQNHWIADNNQSTESTGVAFVKGANVRN